MDSILFVVICPEADQIQSEDGKKYFKTRDVELFSCTVIAA